jgi:wyosine [tRNA(Phe)-imidazoG37] synthetase (radical SAM superfamily)
MRHSSHEYDHLYGPVPSRRLGLSLGVDVVPYKVCCYDCIYCQLGRTTRLIASPERLADPGDVIREIEQWVRHGGTADYITFAGSGEPTLNAGLGEMVSATKALTGIPVAVITNGALLGMSEVREAVSKADVLLPSLDAGTESVFQAINRPAPGLSFTDMTEGLVRAGREFAGSIWLEIMLVRDVNDSDDELLAIEKIAGRIGPDRLQINTVERPSRSGDAHPASGGRLMRACDVLGETAGIIASRVVAPEDNSQWREIEEELMRLLSRRPCTLGDLTSVSGRNANELAKHLQRLVARGLIEQIGDNDPYYRCVTGG